MTDHPKWVYDVVIALLKWNDEHPRLLAEYAGSDKPQRVTDGCGCEALDHVPSDVRDRAQAIANYLRQKENA